MTHPLPPAPGLPPSLRGITFPPDEVLGCQRSRGLLRLNLEMSAGFCNLSCIYCYSEARDYQGGLLRLPELKNIVDDAVQLDVGLRSVVVTGGGEPLMLRRDCLDLLEYIRGRGLQPVLFTNGTLIRTRRDARRLWDTGTTVIGKLNSLADGRPTNILSGRPWAFDRMRRALNLLLEVRGEERDDGMPGLRLGLESVAMRPNAEEIPGLWAWCREHNVYPYVELPKVQGRMKRQSTDLLLSRDEAAQLFARLLEIDVGLGLPPWDPGPPIAAHVCDVLRCGLYICADGEAQPCAGLPIRCGNVTKTPLLSILRSPQLERFRKVKRLVAEPCRSCGRRGGACYGCRGAAYWEAGDHLAVDPMCWHV